MTEKIICVCGAVIRGNSRINAQANLKLHKNSRKHKELMELKKAQQDAPMSKSEGSESGDGGVANE